MRRIWIALVCTFVGVPTLYVAYQVAATLTLLTQVERERDEWQRPADVLKLLNVSKGSTVVDFGCGAGYFALKLSTVVGTSGTVLATDIRRESLAFLWIRAALGRYRNLQVIHGEPDNPRLPPDAVDAILVSNTFHELTAPAQTLETLSHTLKSGGRLVILDRGPRGKPGTTQDPPDGTHHGSLSTSAERYLRSAGFSLVSEDDHFIDRVQDDDRWWVIVARKP